MFHYIQQGHTYANALSNIFNHIRPLEKWVARYKKYGIEGLQTKTILGRPSLNDAKYNVKILDKITLLQTNKKAEEFDLRILKRCCPRILILIIWVKWCALSSNKTRFKLDKF